MHDLRSTTITTLEVAEMMEVEHWEIKIFRSKWNKTDICC